jgi:hypothetical protein
MASEPAPLEPALQQLDETISLWVRAGFGTRDDIVRSAIWIARNFPGKRKYSDEQLRPHAERLFDQRLVELLERQKGWPALTDNDRLDAAFAELEGAGLVARQCFGDDVTDAGAGLTCEAAPEAREAGREVRGYVFYSEQDTAQAVQTGELGLVCGPIPEPEENYRAAADGIARAVAEVLRRHGLSAQVAPDSAGVVLVTLDWMRRRAVI